MRHADDAVRCHMPWANAFGCHLIYCGFNIIHSEADVINANARIKENILEMLRDRLDQFEGQTIRVEKGKSSVSSQLKGRNDADVFILQVEQALKIHDRLLQVANDVSHMTK